MSNIPIEKQVVSLPVAEKLRDKLKSVGVEGAFKYLLYEITDEIDDDGDDRYMFVKVVPSGFEQAFLPSSSRPQYVPTYTLTEMLEMLPHNIYLGKGIDGAKGAYFSMHKLSENNRFNLSFVVQDRRTKAECDYPNLCTEIADKDTNPATAAAKLMIWLIDNGHIKETK